METANDSRPCCPKCSGPVSKWGKDRSGNQRRQCKACKHTFAELPARPLGTMRIPFERAVLCLNLLTEGSSIRATERITGHHRDTITRLLLLVGDKCEKLMAEMVKGVKVENLQADEIWGRVKMSDKTKARKNIVDPKVGSVFCFVGIDADSKLALTHHLGQRTSVHADTFCEKMANAVSPDCRPQISVDGWNGFPEALSYHFGGRADAGCLIKEFGTPGAEELRRYSPPRLIAATKSVIFGSPAEERICTSHVERNNLTIRTNVKRLARLTCAFSKKFECLRAALALHFACYNFTRFHRSLKMTPAMRAGLTRKPWTLAELVAA